MQWTLDMRPAPPALPADLDAEQREVVAHRSGPLLVLAGPGTGKTATLVEAMCARVADAHEPLRANDLLGLTFGRKAARELRTRVAERLGGGQTPTIATFHSFAYALVRQYQGADDYLNPPRLMSGAEEDARIRELLLGAVQDDRVSWPDDLREALPTLGLATEVRAVLAKARELGIDGDELARIGAASGRPVWVALGQFAREEEQVMLLENVMNYSELLLRAAIRARQPEVASALHSRFRAVFVDEYQDTDPLQVQLLKAVVGPAATLIAVGDPDQSIYAFRGADLGGVLRFPEDFRSADGARAATVVLRNARRHGPRIRRAATSVFRSLPAGLDVVHGREHRSPTCAERASEADAVTLRIYDSPGAQAAHIARELRIARVHGSRAWSQLAVLVRTGAQIPPLQRALFAAGIPVVVAADEIPLRAEPAVAVLLAALRLATHNETATAAEVGDVLSGPLVGLTPSDLRRLGRALRAREHLVGVASAPSQELIREFVLGVPSRSPLSPDDPVTTSVGRLRIMLNETRQLIAAGAPPQEVLWQLWTGGSARHGWPERLQNSALSGSASAGHDIDAVTALFDAAERLSDRYRGRLGITSFVASLATQVIASEPVADRGEPAQAVRILTTHRAKGLEWDEVWVVGVQEGVWPDLRTRGSTLRAEELHREGVGSAPRPAELLEEERRLFYVACTRARYALHLAVVEEPGDSDQRPSRFISDVVQRGGAVAERVAGPPPHPLTPEGLVAELRAVAQDPDATKTLRDAAIERLAWLAGQLGSDGEPLVSLAEPQNWWGTRPRTAGPRPVRVVDQPVHLSGSGLDGILSCSLKWFFEHEVHAETARGTATAFGSVVHAVADFVAKADVPAELEAMDGEVERIWSELRFEAPWQAVAERAEARAALSRFLHYHQRADRDLVGTEVRVRAMVVVNTPDGPEAVELTGYIDRVERDADGRLVAIDLKNMRSPVPTGQLPEHGQLGVYQLVLREGGRTATAEANGIPEPVGGAALVQLRVAAEKNSVDPKVQFQDALSTDAPTWVESKLSQATYTLRSENFAATVGVACRYCAFRPACPAHPPGEQVGT